jgi:heptaprenylglyceryl phosphate synthase
MEDFISNRSKLQLEEILRNIEKRKQILEMGSRHGDVLHVIAVDPIIQELYKQAESVLENRTDVVVHISSGNVKYRYLDVNGVVREIV